MTGNPDEQSPPRLDVGEAISSVENSMRDVISRVLEHAYGASWFDHLGVPPERLERWKERREEEPKRRPGGQVDDRLLFYSEFHDLGTIIKKNWEGGFKDCFLNRRRFDVYMDRLEAFRNPDAHSRALLPFEEHLAVGMAGELRQEITVYLSSGAGSPEPEHFARIEEVTDSFGLRAAGRATTGGTGVVLNSEGPVLRPGERVMFRGTAWDPQGGDLWWRITVGEQRVTRPGVSFEWEWVVREPDIADPAFVTFTLHSNRPYNRMTGSDDFLQIWYRVLPPRQ
jgi:hypothetical protein